MKVYVHGNCQAHVIANLLREKFVDWEVKSFEVHSNEIVEGIESYYEAVRTADLILSQPIHDGYRNRADLSTAWVKSEAKRGSAVIVIGGMHFEGHHLGWGPLQGLGDLCNDCLTAHLVAAGLPAPSVLNLMLSTDLLEFNFVREEVDMSLNEMLRRDISDGIDVSISAISSEFSGNNQLFHIVNHPCRPLYVYLVNKVLELIALNDSRIDLAGRDYQPIPHFPMLPSVESACSQWSSPSRRLSRDSLVYAHGYEPMSQRSYFEKMIAQLHEFSADRILTALKSSWKQAAYLQRLAKSATSQKIPELDAWL